MITPASKRPHRVPHSKYGVADQIGAANLVTNESVLKAARLIKTGRTYPLAVEVNQHTPAFRHRSFKLINVQPGQQAGATAGPNKFTFNDELVEGWTGVGTQLNGLGHIGIDNVYYNNNHAADFVTVAGVKKLGVEKIPPIVARAVIVDMCEHFSTEMVDESIEFSSHDIVASLSRHNLSVEKGDVVLFNTGWLKLIGKDNARFLKGEPGIGMEAAQWLAKTDIIAFGGDTWASEVYPNPSGEEFPINQFLLAQHGIYNLELIDTRQLIADNVHEFLFVLGQPLYTGATQVNINPVAIC